MTKSHTTNVVQLHPKEPPITSVSFINDRWVREVGKKRVSRFRLFWDVSPTGDYAEDCKAGRNLALEWFRYVGNKNLAGPALNWIIQDMPPDLTGLEVGFLGVVGSCAAWGGGPEMAEQIVTYYDRKEEELLS